MWPIRRFQQGTPSGRYAPDRRYHDTVAFNVKNEETQRLAKMLAAVTGESVTSAITVAVRERLERLSGAAASERKRKAGRMCALAEDAGQRWTPELRTADHADVLYDERGLPH